jgi:hypothetical protein
MTRVLCTIAMLMLGIAAFGEAVQNQAAPAGEAWLKLIDNGKFGESWSEAATLFRTQVPQQTWIEKAQAARASLGALTSRKLKTIKFAKTLPGAPDGNYALILFNTSFANKASAVETLTLTEDVGAWRAAGYFIR